MEPALDLQSLAAAYARETLTPLALIEQLLAELARTPPPGVFIAQTPERARNAARAVMQRRARGEGLRLYGIPFAVKDNIDVEGLDTTAACPAFAYRALHNAPVVTRLLDAGAILIGKTNLDQFATGLVG